MRSDRRLRLALEPAMPADTIRNGTGHREHVPADVLCGDWEMASGDVSPGGAYSQN
jgi:hypothetical protein